MTRLCAHLGYLFTELPLEQRFVAASEAGFQFVEHPSPFSLAPEAVRALCDENGLTFVQMALPAGDPNRGEKGLACLPGRAEAFQASIVKGISYAKVMGSQFVHVMSGVIPDGMVREQLWETYLGNLRAACDAADAAGIPVMIEPIGAGTLANYLMDDPFLALRAVREMETPNLAMLFDAFHAANAGIDPVSFITEHHANIAHVHIADHPGRHEPGTGAIDFDRLFQTLESVGYRGAIGLEYVPVSSTRDGLKWWDRFTERLHSSKS